MACAISFTLGRTLSSITLDDSNLISCAPPVPKAGRTESEKTTKPIPPIQWVVERQRRTLFGRASMLVRIDAPVVVKPETDSK